MEGIHQTKIEKISQAIYLISNHLKDSEPLKWELRKQSIGFLSCIRSLAEEGDGNVLPPDLVIDALSSYSKDLTSLMSLAVVSGLISRNNGNIIINEIQALIASLRQVVGENSAKAGFVLSEDFFAADPEIQERLGFVNPKGQNSNSLSDISRVVISRNETSASTSALREGIVKDKKSTRQERIVELLRTRSNLTIKDFIAIINDCSEKTIQRELIELVRKGVVKKEGERRWSTYSLN